MPAPDLVAVAVRGPVSSADAQGLSADAARTSVGFLVCRAAAVQRAVMPDGGCRDPSALRAARWTSRVPGTEGVTEGAVSAVPGSRLADPRWLSTGWARSTPV